MGTEARLARGLTAALAMLLLLRPAGAAGGGRAYADWTDRGEAWRAKGEDQRARAAFEKALAFPSADFRAEAGLGGLDAELGRWGEAADFYEKARRKAPANYALCMQLAQIYGDLGRPDLAKGLYAQAKRLAPKQAQAYIEEGYEDLYAGDDAEAREQFQSLIALDSASPYGYHHMASYFDERGDLADAERSLRKALELLRAPGQPRTPGHLYDVLHATRKLADLVERQGRIGEAQALLRQALPEARAQLLWHVKILDELGFLRGRQGDAAGAESYFRQAADLCRPVARCQALPLTVRAGPLIHLAELYSGQGRKSQARALADQAWRSCPSAERLRIIDCHGAAALGDLYWRLGDRTAAEKAYRLFVSQRERLSSMVLLGHAEGRVADVCRKTGRYQEAVSLYREAFEIARRHGQRKRQARLAFGLARAWIWLGWSRLRGAAAAASPDAAPPTRQSPEAFRSEAALARRAAEAGRWDEAAEHYRRALNADPSNYALCMELAKTYDNAGRLDLAKQTYARAKSIDPKQADAYIQEGYEHLYAGDNRKAEEDFQDLIAIDTASPYGYHHMASFYEHRGDLAQAERYARKALEAARRPAPRRLYDELHAACKLSNILAEEGRWDEDEALLRQALPQSTPLLYWHVKILDSLGLAYAGQGRRAQAERSLTQAAALCRPRAACESLALETPLLTPANPLIHLAALYADEGRAARAQEAADRAWSQYPPAERMRAIDFPAAIELGDVYLRLGKDDQAEKAYRLAVSQRRRMLPRLILGHAEGSLAALCAKTGRHPEALALYRDALRIAWLQRQRSRALRLALDLARTWIRSWRGSR